MNQLLRSSFVAGCVVLLQLITALHFALVPHGFSAGLSGFVHVHGALTAERPATPPRTSAEHAALIPGAASCGTDSCPIGFAGAHSVLLVASVASAVLPGVSAEPSALPAVVELARLQVLLTAPKTSPPAPV